MGASIKDVAAKARVSTATVSHVLNGTRATSQMTRERVFAAIAELGYSQNQAARDLVRGRSALLGLIISDIRNPFFPDITAAFQDTAIAHRMEALVLNSNYDPQRTLHAVNRLIGLRVPGVAILTSSIDPAIIHLLADKGIAAVYLDLGPVGRGISNILVNYEAGIEQATEHLASLGHSRISYIGGPRDMDSAQRRKRAFLQTAARLGLQTDQVIDADFTVKGAYLACSHMADGNLPTAVVAGNDLTAIGVMHWAFDEKLRVPEDISVVGFDGIIFSEYTQPALTTAAVPRSEIGRVAFDALWKMISDDNLTGQEFLVEPRLVVRQSTAPPR